MSSSGEQSPETSAGQGPSAGLMARAKTAAKNPHLVWVATNAPSPRQAAIVCQILGLTNEDEKNTKALAVLKRDRPAEFEKLFGSQSINTIQEKQEEEMEVKFGIGHYQKIATEKEEVLWSKIIEFLGFPLWSHVYKLRLGKIINGMSMLFRTGDHSIVEVEALVGAPLEWGGKVVRIKTRGTSHFCNLEQSGRTGVIASWNDIYVYVYNREFLPFAKKLAMAYERETARRRKPAKAVVLKEY